MPHVKLVRGSNYNTMGLGSYVSGRVYRVSEDVAERLLDATVDGESCFEAVDEKEAKGGVSVTKKKKTAKKAASKDSDEAKSNKADNDNDGDTVTV